MVSTARARPLVLYLDDLIIVHSMKYPGSIYKSCDCYLVAPMYLIRFCSFNFCGKMLITRGQGQCLF